MLQLAAGRGPHRGGGSAQGRAPPGGLAGDHHGPGHAGGCRRREVESIPADRPLVLATGPLTTDALAASIATALGTEHLAYYDAIAPIVSADSIDRSVVWAQSRYDKGGADYLNCPFDETQYADFLEAVRGADQVAPRPFEKARYFERI